MQRSVVLSLGLSTRERWTLSRHEAPPFSSRALARWAPAADGSVDTAEETDAEELRQQTLVKDNERIEREREELDLVAAGCRSP
jgi:hypothetical protein